MRISYEDTVSAYEREIRTTLRGFKPVHAFLETWVHDEDPVRSLLSMVEAGELGGIPGLDILIGEGTARKLDQRRLKELTSKVGKVAIEAHPDGLLLKVAYAS